MNLIQALTQQIAARGRELAKAQTTIHNQRGVIRKLKTDIAVLERREVEVDLKVRRMLALQESALALLDSVKREVEKAASAPHIIRMDAQ